MAIKAIRGEPVEIQDAFKPFVDRPGDYLIVGLAMQSGVVVCVVGIIATCFIFFFAPVLVAQGADYRGALRNAKDISLAHLGEVLALLLIVALINIAGALVFGIGLFVTLPVTYIAVVEAYEQLRKQSSDIVAKPE